MFNWIKLIERNLRRNLRRTILTILTIALATFIYTVLVSVPASMDRIIKDASGTLRLIVVNKTAPWEDLPARYCDQITKLPGAAACVGITGWFATWRNVSEPILAFGVGPEIADVFPDYQLSREQQSLSLRDRRSATVGTVLMKKMGWKLGDHITLQGTDATDSPTRISRGILSFAPTAPPICNRLRNLSTSTSPTPTMRRAA
jgi:putative ABC transport system permease protein